MTKDEVREMLGNLKNSRKVDFKRITKRQAQAYINRFADGLAKFSLEEVMEVLPMNYLPPIATDSDMDRLLKNLIEDCEFNRLTQVEQEKQKEETLQRWHELCEGKENLSNHKEVNYKDLPF